MRRLLYVLTVSLFVLGGFGWFSGFFLPWYGPSFEMPLGDLEGIAVDSAGNIYCASQFYDRIQKYGQDGRFIVGWQVKCAGGVFRIRMNRHDEVEVATARNNMFYRFSPQGEEIKRKQVDANYFGGFGLFNKRQCRGPNDTVYSIGSTPFPSVVKVSPSGAKMTVVSTPFHKWLIMGPAPAWFFWMVGTVILMFLNKEKMFQKIKETWLLTTRGEFEK